TFWQQAATTGVAGMQLWPDRVSFNIIGNRENARSYEELDSLWKQWLPVWASHFNVAEFNGVALEYVNLLSEDTLPTFVQDATLRIGDVLTILNKLPGPRQNLLGPFDFQLNVDGKTDPPSQFLAHCLTTGMSPTKVPIIQLRFVARTYLEQDRRIELK